MPSSVQKANNVTMRYTSPVHGQQTSQLTAGPLIRGFLLLLQRSQQTHTKIIGVFSQSKRKSNKSLCTRQNQTQTPKPQTNTSFSLSNTSKEPANVKRNRKIKIQTTEAKQNTSRKQIKKMITPTPPPKKKKKSKQTKSLFFAEPPAVAQPTSRRHAAALGYQPLPQT